MTRFIGVDLHTTQLTACSLTENGSKQIKTFQLSRIEDFLCGLNETDSIAVEATGNSRWFGEQVREKTSRIVIVDPRSFEVIRRSVKKTDERDSESLARFLSAGLLPAARQRTREQEAVQSLAQTREKLVGTRTALVNQVHALLVQNGRKEKRERLTTAKGLTQVREKYVWSAAEEIQLKVIAAQISSLNQGIKQLDEAIAAAGGQLEGFDNLVSIKGIGKRSAALLLSVIGEVRDFPSEGRLASYFGIVPRVRNSADVQHHG